MKKGDIKKAELIATGEQLFCRNGYEQTSVQDILDILGTSKGSFYHHFLSKGALLEAVCRQRAEAMAMDTLTKIPKASVYDKVNFCLEGMIPWKNEKLSFLLMLLPVFDLPEGWSVKHAYQAALANAFHPILLELLCEGHENGELFCPHAVEQARLVLLLINDLWGSISETIIQAEKQHEPMEPAAALETLDQTRLAVEKIISAPYGSLRLFDLPDLNILAGQIHFHWKNP